MPETPEAKPSDGKLKQKYRTFTSVHSARGMWGYSVNALLRPMEEKKEQVQADKEATSAGGMEGGKEKQTLGKGTPKTELAEKAVTEEAKKKPSQTEAEKNKVDQKEPEKK